MWKDYSLSYIRKNRASSFSVLAAALIAAAFLSLLFSLMYSMWDYERTRIVAEEGDYHARLTGRIDEEKLELIRGWANVESAVVRKQGAEGENTVVDIRLKDPSDIYEEMPKIAALAGIPESQTEYHDQLLSLFLVRSPRDPDGAMMLALFAAVSVFACIALILVIHNAFAVFMNDRVHQFGILSSVGATPGQIRFCLLQEAGLLCALPVLFGNLAGMAAAAGLLEGINLYLKKAAPDRLPSHFVFHPAVFLLSVLCAAVTVWASARIPAGRLSRLTPLEAIRGGGEFSLKRKKHSPILSLLFGVEGELAGNALKAQRKALRAAGLSLILSFLAFTLMESVLSLSRLSTQITYWDRYQNAWDVMITVKNTQIAPFGKTEELSRIRSLSGVRDVLAYQKARAQRLLTDGELSDAYREAGGFRDGTGKRLVSAPLIILDDAAFLSYCGQIGAEPRLDGAVVLNQVRDDTDPNFRVRNVFPYLKEGQETAVLYCAGQEGSSAGIRVLGYAQELPALREEYQTLDYYEMIHVLPVSLWEEIGREINGAEEDMYIRVFAEENAERAGLEALERELAQAIGGSYEIESENRIGEEEASDSSYRALMTIIGGFCILLAMIGIGNVFTNTLGFARERRREVARYLSVGMMPQSIRKLFCVEALVLAGRPVLVTLPVLAVISWIFMRVAYLDPALLLRCVPAAPLLAFVLADFAFVGLAYYIGGRTVLRMNLADALRDDTLQ